MVWWCSLDGSLSWLLYLYNVLSNILGKTWRNMAKHWMFLRWLSKLNESQDSVPAGFRMWYPPSLQGIGICTIILQTPACFHQWFIFEVDHGSHPKYTTHSFMPCAEWAEWPQSWPQNLMADCHVHHFFPSRIAGRTHPCNHVYKFGFPVLQAVWTLPPAGSEWHETWHRLRKSQSHAGELSCLSLSFGRDGDSQLTHWCEFLVFADEKVLMYYRNKTFSVWRKIWHIDRWSEQCPSLQVCRIYFPGTCQWRDPLRSDRDRSSSVPTTVLVYTIYSYITYVWYAVSICLNWMTNYDLISSASKGLNMTPFRSLFAFVRQRNRPRVN